VAEGSIIPMSYLYSQQVSTPSEHLDSLQVILSTSTQLWSYMDPTNQASSLIYLGPTAKRSAPKRMSVELCDHARGPPIRSSLFPSSITAKNTPVLYSDLFPWDMVVLDLSLPFPLWDSTKTSQLQICQSPSSFMKLSSSLEPAPEPPSSQCHAPFTAQNYNPTYRDSSFTALRVHVSPPW